MTWTTRPRSDHHGVPVIRAGAGPRIVLLHGVGLRAEAWAPVIDRLATRYSVLAPDMPGHGQHAPQPGLGAITDYAALLGAVLDGPGVVVGHSMGAMIATALAALHADKVLALGALNAVFERTAAAKAAVRARAGALDGTTLPDPEPTLDRWFGADQSPERAACAAWLRAVDPEGYRAAYTVFAQDDGPHRDTLSALRVPALSMTGADEPNSTPAMSQAMAGLAPSGYARVVEGAAHMLPMTHPDTVADEIHRLATKSPATQEQG